MVKKYDWLLEKAKFVKCPVCKKKVETVICNGVQKYFDVNGAYHECHRNAKVK